MNPKPHPRGGARLSCWVALCGLGLVVPGRAMAAAEALAAPNTGMAKAPVAPGPAAAPASAAAVPPVRAASPAGAAAAPAVPAGPPAGAAAVPTASPAGAAAVPTASPATAAVAPAAPSAPAAPAVDAPAAADALGKGRDRPVDDFTSPSWNEEHGTDDLGYGWILLRTMVVLGLVVGLIYLTLNLGLRRLMGIKGPAGGRASVVTLLERLPLDQKRALFVVRAAGEYLLIGGGDGSLSLISKLDSAEVERLQREKPPSPLALSPFLQKLLTRRGGPPPPTA